MTSTLNQRLSSRRAIRILCCVLSIATAVWASPLRAQEKQPPAASAQRQHTPLLIVKNLSGETTTLSPEQFGKLPRSTVEAEVPHTDQTATYEGALLGHVLQEAGVQETSKSDGGVYLVGTGPGDPELITVKAARILRNADLVFCYHWMKDELAPFVQPGVVEVVPHGLQGGRYLGQKPEEFPEDQRDRAHEELAKLKERLAGLVAEGKTVAFADNGDPMIFSPWAWVPQQLEEFNAVVIPGLSSFNAANAAVKRSVAGLGFVTISSGVEMGSPDENGRLAGTVVFFTHRRKLDSLLPELRSRYPADTPAAIVCSVSYPGEKVIRGTLGTILDVLGKEKLPHLYLFYVGDALGQGACCR
ncbi:MAG: hypothetical protein HQ582_24210 [Planctomycetes bacterium]|nr:hypothetical protein [Planctomycetota bacterium]